jgi:hypothetical protein
MADNGSTRLPRYPFTRGSAPADTPARDAQASDPLSELARLIGQQDPFVDPVPPAARRDLRDILAGRRDPEPEPTSWDEPPLAERRDSVAPGRRESDWAAAPSLPPVPQYESEPYYDDPPPVSDNFQSSRAGYQSYTQSHTSDVPVFELPHLDQDHPPAPYEAPSDYGQGAVDVPLYGDNGQLLQPDLHDDETYPPDSYPAAPYQPEEAPPRSRKSLVAVIAVFCLAVAGTAGAYAYRTMFSGGIVGTPPLIRADSTPNKVPAQGGEAAGKQIYDRFGGDKSQNEKMVSREEQPVDVRPAQGRPAFPSQPAQSGTPAQAGWPAAPGTTNTPASSGGANAVNEPRKIRTIPIRSDQVASAPSSVETQAAPPSPSAPPATQPAARPEPRPASPPRQHPPTASSGGPLSLNPQASARTASASPPPRAAETAATGAYIVQIAAHKTHEEASAAFRSAQSKYPSVLGGQKMLIRKKEIAGQGTFYGAQVGPFASRSDAVSLCDSLKSAGGTCIVQRN